MPGRRYGRGRSSRKTQRSRRSKTTNNRRIGGMMGPSPSPFRPRKVPFAQPLACSCECSEMGQLEGYCSFCIGANNHETPERMCSTGQGAVWCNWECGSNSRGFQNTMKRGGRVNTTNNRSRFSGRTQNNPKGKFKK